MTRTGRLVFCFCALLVSGCIGIQKLRMDPGVARGGYAGTEVEEGLNRVRTLKVEINATADGTFDRDLVSVVAQQISSLGIRVIVPGDSDYARKADAVLRLKTKSRPLKLKYYAPFDDPFFHKGSTDYGKVLSTGHEASCEIDLFVFNRLVYYNTLHARYGPPPSGTRDELERYSVASQQWVVASILDQLHIQLRFFILRLHQHVPTWTPVSDSLANDSCSQKPRK